MSDRLTYQTDTNQYELKCCLFTAKSDDSPMLKDCAEKGIHFCSEVNKVIDKLAHYEDLEEEGRLIELPCQWGDTVYQIVECDNGIYKISKMKVHATSPYGQLYGDKIWNCYIANKYSKSYCRYFDFGRTVFMTRKEAEAKLKEIRNIKKN